MAHKRRRVFFVLDSLDEGPVGDHVATLLGRLPRSRYEPRVVTLDGEGPLGDRIRAMRVAVHALPDGGVLDPVLAVPRLRKLLTGLDAEIVQAFHHAAGAVAELAAPKGVPVVRFVPSLRNKSDPLSIRIAGAMEGVTSRRGSIRFVVGADEARAGVAEHYGVESVDVIPEAIDVAELRSQVEALEESEARRRVGVRTGEHAIVCLTGFRDEGSIEALLSGFAMARVEDPALRLFLVGTGPSETHARWRAEEMHMGDALIFMGEPESYPALLAAATMVVDAMPWPGVSRAGLEAAIAGVPVLVWNEGEDVGDVQASPARIGASPERFAGELVHVAKDGALRARLAVAGSALATESDVSRVAEQWADFYDDVIDNAMRDA